MELARVGQVKAQPAGEEMLVYRIGDLWPSRNGSFARPYGREVQSKNDRRMDT
jgi:hypothetical protein